MLKRGFPFPVLAPILLGGMRGDVRIEKQLCLQGQLSLSNDLLSISSSLISGKLFIISSYVVNFSSV